MVCCNLLGFVLRFLLFLTNLHHITSECSPQASKTPAFFSQLHNHNFRHWPTGNETARMSPANLWTSNLWRLLWPPISCLRVSKIHFSPAQKGWGSGHDENPAKVKTSRHPQLKGLTSLHRYLVFATPFLQMSLFCSQKDVQADLAVSQEWWVSRYPLTGFSLVFFPSFYSII